MPPDILQEILSTAVYAPSGDNSQPWEFMPTESGVAIFNTPGADETLYNFRQRGSYLAHGALVENISLLAARAGYRTEVAPFPEGEACTARLRFSKTAPFEDVLCSTIPARTTNRKPYAKTPLSPAHRQALLEAAGDKEAALHIVEDAAALEELAVLVSLNERLLMENRPLHDFLFSMIRWSPEEDAARPGLYIKTMELPPPVESMFGYVLNRWPLVSLLNMFGFSRAISRQTAELYRSCAAMGVIYIAAERDEQFFAAGRTLQRVWLAATSTGLSLHPLAAIPYLGQRVRAGETEDFSPEHIALIKAADARMAALCQMREGATIAMLFRVGYGDAPTARSHKRPPVMRSALV